MRRYIIEEDNRIYREDSSKVEVFPDQSMLSKLEGGRHVMVRSVFKHPTLGELHLSTNGTIGYWTLALDELTLNCPFMLIDKVLVPVMEAKETPVMSLKWCPPSGMHLRLVVQINAEIGAKGPTGKLTAVKVWLPVFAKLVARECYRLPLPNLFEDVGVCMGEGNLAKAALNWSHISLLEDVVAKFNSGQWNTHLWTSVEKTQQMFRFKATEKDVKTLPPAVEDWTTICEKLVPPVLPYMIL